MGQRKAEAILTLLIFINGTAFLFTKIGIGDLPPLTLVGLRMGIGFVPLAIFYFLRHGSVNGPTLRAALVLGVLMFGVMSTQAYGMFTLTSSEGAFLATTTVAFVPLMTAILTRKLPGRATIESVALTLAGVALICGIYPGGQGVGFSSGVVLYLLGAIAYGLHIIVVGKFDERVDLVAAAILEMAVASVLAFAGSFLFEVPQLPSTPQSWALIIVLGVFTTGFGMGFQPMVQRFTSPERYGVLFALTPLFAAVLGFLVLGETFAPAAVVGAVLLLAGVLVSELSGSEALERLRYATLSFLPVGRVMRVRRIDRF